MTNEVAETSSSALGRALTWQTKAMIIGGVLGAAVGIAGAYMLSQRTKDGETPEISVGEGVKIGVLVFGMLRSIANL